MKRFQHVPLRSVEEVRVALREGRKVLLDQSPALPQMSAPIPVVRAREVDGVTFVSDGAGREYPIAGSFYCYWQDMVEVPA